MKSYDVIVIGAGPAGLAACKVLAMNKKSVLLVDKDHLGGTCLNYGCMPTKFRLRFGRNNRSVLEDQRKMVESLNQAIEKNFKALGVDVRYGEATLKDEHIVLVDGEEFYGKYIFLGIGSKSRSLEGVEVDGRRIFYAEDLLWYFPEERVGKFQIIGAGPIGIEFAFMFRELADEIVVCDIADEILPKEDRDIASRLRALMQKMGIKFQLGSKVMVDDSADIVLIGIGRVGKADELKALLGPVQVEVGERGFIRTDEFLRTSVSNIFAGGDCIGRQFFAHTALFEGKVAAMNILGRMVPLRYPAIPRVVFSDPPVASVGERQDDLVFETISFPHGEMFFLYPVMGKLKVGLTKDGVIKFASMVGPGASELVTFFTLAIDKNITLDEIRSIIYAHPTVAEAFSRLGY